MSPPTISVVMPCHDAGRYLAGALESVLSQTFEDFELIVIDDGSTDESPAVLRRYAERDGRVRLLVRPNVGLVRTLNEMLGMARGEFVARMDADDVSMPDRFRLQVDYLRAHPEVVVAAGRVEMTDPEGDALCVWCTEETHEGIDRAHLEGVGGTICHPAAMIRADALRRVGGYRTEFELCEDIDLWLRLAEVGRLVNLPEVVLKYRQHASSRGYTHQDRQTRFTSQAVRDARLRRGLPGLGPDPAPEGRSKWRGEAEHRGNWAWWALSGGNVRSARKNALRRLRLRPLSPDSWKLIACALRGR